MTTGHSNHRGHVLDNSGDPLRACRYCGLIIATASAAALRADCPERGPAPPQEERMAPEATCNTDSQAARPFDEAGGFSHVTI